MNLHTDTYLLIDENVKRHLDNKQLLLSYYLTSITLLLLFEPSELKWCIVFNHLDRFFFTTI